jgi:hypothetical protein
VVVVGVVNCWGRNLFGTGEDFHRGIIMVEVFINVKPEVEVSADSSTDF